MRAKTNKVNINYDIFIYLFKLKKLAKLNSIYKNKKKNTYKNALDTRLSLAIRHYRINS